jgi:hypothetical protein
LIKTFFERKSMCKKRFVIGFVLLAMSVMPLAGCNKANQMDPNGVITGIAVARAVNAATAPVNPYSPFVEIILAAVAVAAAAWGKAKATQVTTAATTLGAVTQAVENAPQAVQDSIKTAVAANLAAAQITTAGKALISASKTN